jgi:UPF0716 protein FxsA
MFRLFLLFTFLPFVELWLLLQLARRTGVGGTIAVVVTTALTGAALVRWQGLRTVRRIQEQLAAGAVPSNALADGLFILLAGAFLVTPGLITDTIGFLLLIPPVRKLLSGWVVQQFLSSARFQMRSFTAGPNGPQLTSGSTIWTNEPTSPRNDSIIDAEFTRRPDDPRLPDRSSSP